MQENSVVIVLTGQAGTVINNVSGDIWVLLRNGDIWVGSEGMVRYPQSQEDLDAAIVDVERL